ncbi:MAG: SAM-dependent DNA methyltransferase, partial [Myxococcales bacterium]|nr:SAM-dependent DNA methyltransferase [Myxococcales bacterium]
MASTLEPKAAITGELKNKVDRLWTCFWNNGISNPLTVLEQISYLLFIKSLDERRWSQLRAMADGEAMLALVRDELFPFIKGLGGPEGTSAYARYMQDAVFLVTNAPLLATVVAQIDQLPTRERDTMGDLYEYMLSKLTTAGTAGQFRTPRHI